MKTWLKYLSVTTGIAVAVLSILPANNLAQTSETYRPPKGKVREQTRKAGGSRGCNISLEDAVTLLVPQDHTATTISARPTFFWHLSQKLSLPLRFTLLEPGKKPILTKELKPEPGIIGLKLPQNSAPLEVGKTYRWTVTVVCNPSKPSRNLFAIAWIERVSLPTATQLSNNTKDRSSCSLSYARAGIWYDALSCSYNTSGKHQNNHNNSWQQFQSLLEEIGLAYIAHQTPALSLYL
ncbi:MAG: DUF928 domain-containing protein [Cyanobacteria bacterium P01_A01_bin.84]